MKKMIFAAIALLTALGVAAQEPKWLEVKTDSLHFDANFILPDSLATFAPWKPDFRNMEPLAINPAVSMSSVVVIRQEHLPAKVTVLNNNVLRMGRYVSFSNGQSWNYGPFPNSFLDARTLSMPLPR